MVPPVTEKSLRYSGLPGKSAISHSSPPLLSWLVDKAVFSTSGRSGITEVGTMASSGRGASQPFPVPDEQRELWTGAAVAGCTLPCPHPSGTLVIVSHPECLGLSNTTLEEKACPQRGSYCKGREKCSHNEHSSGQVRTRCSWISNDNDNTHLINRLKCGSIFDGNLQCVIAEELPSPILVSLLQSWKLEFLPFVS